MAEYKEVFMLFDKDEDGVLSFPELAVVMKSLGQRPSGTYLLILKILHFSVQNYKKNTETFLNCRNKFYIENSQFL